MFAYEQSFLCLAYHPDIWYEAANFLHEQSKQFKQENKNEDAEKYAKNAEELYERAITDFMQNNLLLNLAYAGFQ